MSARVCIALQASVRSYLLIKLLEDALTETSYLADTADLSYSAHLDGLAGITIQVTC